MKLYKYIKVISKQGEEEIIDPKLINALTDSKIFFSHPAKFNDPLECVIPIKINDYEKNESKYKSYIEKIFKEQTGINSNSSNKRLQRFYETINFGIPLENCLVACLTKKENNALMWSHYADQYQGACLCYDIPDDIEEFQKKICWSNEIQELAKNKIRAQIQEVKYRSKRFFLEIENTNLPVEEWKFKNDYKIENAIFIKPKFWSYEQEMRIALILPFGCG